MSDFSLFFEGDLLVRFFIAIRLRIFNLLLTCESGGESKVDENVILLKCLSDS